MPSATRLWFARHGEPEAPFVGAFIGRTDCGLSDLGRHQAEAIKAYLEDAPIDAILASPARRARDTVAPLAAKRGIPVRPVKGLAEMDFGKWEGLRWDDILRLDRAYAERWQEDPSALPPGVEGEACADFQARIDEALGEILDEFRGRMVVVGGHAGTNRAILAHLLRIEYLDAFVFAQDYGCLNAAAWPEGMRGQVALVNLVPGPRSDTAGE
jgi:broad specificity phosphatase PhoE